MTITRTMRIGDTDVTYTARVDSIEVSHGGDDADVPGASYVYTEYLRDDAAGDDRRPVVFVFNGGPGSSSVWTHLGGIGPRRVAGADSLTPATSPPFELVDNADSILDTADLVFIDPPGTGYSRLLDASAASAFYGVEQDARATLEFIARWTRARRRERAPRFIAGESYGTVRAARMARLMNGGPFRGGRTRSTSLSGAIVLGPGFIVGESGWRGDVAAALELPTLAATARYHGTAADVADEEVWRFARDTLLPTLVAGHDAGEARRRSVAERMAEFTGIDAAVLLEHDLTITVDAFRRLALAATGQQVGKYDSRFTLPSAGAGDDIVADDPGMGRYMPQFLGAIEPYLRDELGDSRGDEYIGIAFFPFANVWDWDEVQQDSTPGIFGEFAEALRRSPDFELFVGVGDYDLVTTHAATRYSLARHRFDRDRVHLRRYASGHMPYLGAQPRGELARDLREFIGRRSA